MLIIFQIKANSNECEKDKFSEPPEKLKNRTRNAQKSMKFAQNVLNVRACSISISKLNLFQYFSF